MNIQHWLKRDAFIRTIVIIVLLVLVVTETGVLVRDLRVHKASRPTFHSKGTTPDIEPWMTFAYINMLYKLPSDLLEVRLGIGDVRYPNLEISKLARDRNMNDTELSELVASIVRDYTSR